MPKKPARKRPSIQPIEFPRPTVADILRLYGRKGIQVDEIERLIADRSRRSDAHAKAWLHFFLAWVKGQRSVVSKEIRRLAASDGINRAPVIIPLSRYDYDNSKVIDDRGGGELRLVWEGDRLALAFFGTGMVADCYDMADYVRQRFHLLRVSPQGRAADWDDPAVAVACLDNLADWATKRLAKLEGRDSQPQYVTLDQMAAMIQRSKRTVEKWKVRIANPLPPADVEGGGGKPDEWLWSNIRPWLAKESGKKLPYKFPKMRSARRN
ncbi:MAG TPA: hypothetical protein VGP76_00645 [Planctomycetaceae bacterium]|jgi:hypothetical protein|nr:hypothetical protein [Planctomycetaceae bacterium]